jgi:hypothetical protein
MTNKKNELSTKQVQAINGATASVFNSLQQAAILRAIEVSLNPKEYEDAEQGDAEDAKARTLREEREQAERDAEAVKVAQAQAAAIDSAKATPNVLNQGNYQDVVETTRAAVQARDPELAQANVDLGRAEAAKVDAKKATKKVK